MLLNWKTSLQLGVCSKNRFRKLLLNAGGGVGWVPLKLCERLDSLVFLCLTQNFLIFNAVRGGVLQMPAISAREHVYKQVLCQNHGFRKCHICKVSIFGWFLFEGNFCWYRWCWVGLGKTRKKHSHVLVGCYQHHQDHQINTITSEAKVKKRKT